MATTLTERLVTAFAQAQAQGLRQADIARHVGVSRATVTAWMKGDAVSLKPGHLFAVADLLGIEARWLATGQGPRAALRMPSDQPQLLADMAALRDGDRAAVRLLIHQLAEARRDREP